jgi:hypothetical protein
MVRLFPWRRVVIVYASCHWDANENRRCCSQLRNDYDCIVILEVSSPFMGCGHVSWRCWKKAMI